MMVKGFGICDKDLVCFNRPRKHQQATFLSDIITSKGDKIDKVLIPNWQKTHKGFLGKNRSTKIFGIEQPTKENWNL